MVRDSKRSRMAHGWSTIGKLPHMGHLTALRLTAVFRFVAPAPGAGIVYGLGAPVHALLERYLVLGWRQAEVTEV